MMPNIFIANIPKKSTPRFTCMPILGTTHEENICNMFQWKATAGETSSCSQSTIDSLGET